ncbi:MAG: carbamate kinase [Hyphomicrobiales bacterium]|nr:carbamate kinase [Hyphomicrobiales bacterium]
MRIVAALGGNALLRRGEEPTAGNQRRNVRIAAQALAPLALAHELVITHGNGPQVGLLALQSAAYKPDEVYPLDVLDAETEGQIGYLIEQEMRNLLPADRPCATLLTQIEVNAQDPAFRTPTKPIGPVYGEADARTLESTRGWCFTQDGKDFRRVVASPQPQRILEQDVIDLLIKEGVIVICAGGGGIPTIRGQGGQFVGIEAVIDKDQASALLARQVKADALLMLTNVDAVHERWGAPTSNRFRKISLENIRRFTFAAGSMGPKVDAACSFVEATDGIAGIGALKDAEAILGGHAGTLITRSAGQTVYWD